MPDSRLALRITPKQVANSWESLFSSPKKLLQFDTGRQTGFHLIESSLLFSCSRQFGGLCAALPVRRRRLFRGGLSLFGDPSSGQFGAASESRRARSSAPGSSIYRALFIWQVLRVCPPEQLSFLSVRTKETAAASLSFSAKINHLFSSLCSASIRG